MNLLVHLDPADDVAVAARELSPDSTVDGPDGPLAVRSVVPAGHKIAIRAIPSGQPIRKYGQYIGIATADIAAGEHVHSHNLAIGTPPGAPGTAPTASQAPSVEPFPDHLPSTFDGYRRADGRVGTRNFLAVMTTVNCSATVAQQAVRRSEYTLPEQYPGIDGVIALVHTSGCGMAEAGPGPELLRRTMVGYARHPNIVGLVLVGLGCEVNDLDGVARRITGETSVPIETVSIQQAGGTRAAIDLTISALNTLAARTSGTQRTSCPVSELTVGLQCGGSDGWSGITANPALGVATDLLVAAGGTAFLGETPEIFGAEHLLAARATDPAVGAQVFERIEWWKEYTSAAGTSMDGNPSPGNKAGGITTILEKSLGAVAKSGGGPLAAVCGYAEAAPRPGLVFMDTPGYDPVSATGMVAGGAQVIAFTTGRGSVFGSRPAPTIKLATNAELARRMADDMDVDCSPVIESGKSLRDMGIEVYLRILETASGRRSRSEELGVGGEEMVPWHLGAVL